jgi:hypothetical protein
MRDKNKSKTHLIMGAVCGMQNSQYRNGEMRANAEINQKFTRLELQPEIFLVRVGNPPQPKG